MLVRVLGAPRIRITAHVGASGWRWGSVSSYRSRTSPGRCSLWLAEPPRSLFGEE